MCAGLQGRHSLSFGFHGELSRVDLDNQFLRGGTFQFTSDVTNYAIASFLLGRVRSFRQGAGEFKNNRNKFLGFYAQDSFRVNKRLTLNYGLRYEPVFPWREVRGRVEQFRPDAYWRGETSTQFVNAPPGLFFPGDPGVPGIRHPRSLQELRSARRLRLRRDRRWQDQHSRGGACSTIRGSRASSITASST